MDGYVEYMLREINQTSGQDGGVGKHGSPPSTTTAKITTRLQKKYHPESSENRAVWKSDKQGIKEVTFIQMGRNDRDEEMWNGRSHKHVRWIKVERGTSGVNQPRVPVPGR